MSNRNAISSALFALIQNANGTGANQFPFKTFVQRAFAPGKVPGAGMPAGMLIKVGEVSEARPTRGSALWRYILDYTFLVYATSQNPQSTDATQPVDEQTLINPILDALDNAFTTVPPGEKQTLGGIVEDAWVDGKTDIAQAIIDQHVVIAIPIKVICGRWQLLGTP